MTLSQSIHTVRPHFDRQSLPTMATRRFVSAMLGYAPNLVGWPNFNCDLAGDLAARRNQVVAEPSQFPARRIGECYSGARWSRDEWLRGVVHRAPLYVRPSPSGVRRGAHLGSFGAAALRTAVAVARRPPGYRLRRGTDPSGNGTRHCDPVMNHTQLLRLYREETCVCGAGGNASERWAHGHR